jgi:hypothetical protein
MGDGPADSALCVLCGLHFWKVHGYWPHVKNPRSISEKIWNRMLFDRNPRWTMLSDKLRVRDYVAQKIGSEYLIPLLWTGDKPEEIPFDELPTKFVIKTTHGCRYNVIVKDKTRLNRAKTVQQLKKWLRENYCQDYLLGTEWAYKNIQPTIIVEVFVEDNGNVPTDYKFFCYSGRAEYVQISIDRFGDASEKILDSDLNPLDLYNGLKLFPGTVVRPVNYGDMVRIAESLAQEYDFIRVDLYSVGGRIYFGELTCYPAAGLARFVPRTYDFLFGEKWNMA